MRQVKLLSGLVFIVVWSLSIPVSLAVPFADDSAAKEAIKRVGGTINEARVDSITNNVHFNAIAATLDHVRVDDAIVEQIGRLRGIFCLGLADTGITKSQFCQLRNLQNLEFLVLFGEEVDDEFLDAVCELSTLKVLKLRDVKASDSGLAQLARLSNLEELEIQESDVGPKALDAIARLKRLRRLRLPGAVYDQKDLAALKSLSGLEELDLENFANRITDLSFLDGLRNLRTLDLSQPGLRDDALKGLSNLKQLEWLYIWDQSDISDVGLKSIASLENLVSICIASNQITDAGLVSLTANRHLRRLCVTSPRITNQGLESICKTFNDLEPANGLGRLSTVPEFTPSTTFRRRL